MTESDLRTTLNLPKTDFPMKANLPQAEPKRLARWKGRGSTRRCATARQGRPPFVLHDGPPYANGHIHLGTALNKILKDVVVRSRSMAGHDSPYVPGWDCHGLPIELKVERDLGSKKHEMKPVAFRQACREYAEKFVDIQREEFERLGVLGEWEDALPHDVARLPGDDRAPARRPSPRRASSTRPRSRCTGASRAAPRWPRPRSSTTSATRARRSTCASRSRPRRPRALADRHPALAGKPVSAVIWTTTPWTLPANLALAFHPEVGVRVLPGRGHARGAAAREGDERGRSRKARSASASGRPLADVKGAEPRGRALPPSRGSTATRRACSPTT